MLALRGQEFRRELSQDQYLLKGREETGRMEKVGCAVVLEPALAHPLGQDVGFLRTGVT